MRILTVAAPPPLPRCPFSRWPHSCRAVGVATVHGMRIRVSFSKKHEAKERSLHAQAPLEADLPQPARSALRIAEHRPGFPRQLQGVLDRVGFLPIPEDGE